MPLDISCPKGHYYVHHDIYTDWPEGAPYCPTCFKEWKSTNLEADTASEVFETIRKLFPFGDPRYYKNLLKRAQTHNDKNADYSGRTGDHFKNFRPAERYGVPAFIGALIRLSDKEERKTNVLMNGNTVKDESFLDTLQDEAVYADIVSILYEDFMVSNTNAHKILELLRECKTLIEEGYKPNNSNDLGPKT